MNTPKPRRVVLDFAVILCIMVLGAVLLDEVFLAVAQAIRCAKL